MCLYHLIAKLFLIRVWYFRSDNAICSFGQYIERQELIPILMYNILAGATILIYNIWPKLNTFWWNSRQQFDNEKRLVHL
jgi:hypothetical protein